MVARRDLTPDPQTALRNLMDQLAEASKKQTTVPAGVKDMGETGDIVWSVPDPDPENPVVEKSMRELDGVLDDTRQELADAIATLAELNNVTIPELEDALSGLGDLDAIKDELENLGDLSGVGRLTTQGPPPADPVIGQTIWVAPNGRVFRAVDCETED